MWDQDRANDFVDRVFGKAYVDPQDPKRVSSSTIRDKTKEKVGGVGNYGLSIPKKPIRGGGKKPNTIDEVPKRSLYTFNEGKRRRPNGPSSREYHGEHYHEIYDPDYKAQERANQNQTSRHETIPSWEGRTKHSGKVAGTRANRTQGSRGVTSRKPHISVGGNTMIAPAGRHSAERN